MAVFVFMIDTSASMNRRFGRSALTYLEVAKNAIQHFLKVHSRKMGEKGANDRFMLVTYEDGPDKIKTSFREPPNVLLDELEQIKATDLTSLPLALHAVFEFLHLHRMNHGTDDISMGYYPSHFEPTYILLLKDDGKISTVQGVENKLILPGLRVPGCDFFGPPFRWDQRLYVLSMQATEAPLDRELQAMCAAMGGQQLAVHTPVGMHHTLEALFGISRPDFPNAINVFHNSGLMVQWQSENSGTNREGPKAIMPAMKGACHFPIPEASWYDVTLRTFPMRRSSHPILTYRRKPITFELPEMWPVDKYTVHPCALAAELATQPLGTKWPVFVDGASRPSARAAPFGYLEYAPDKQVVYLYILGWDFPVLLDLVNQHATLSVSDPLKWKREWNERFLPSIPSYYISPLRKVLLSRGLMDLIPEAHNMRVWSQSARVHLKEILAKAKVEYDKQLQSVCYVSRKRDGPRLTELATEVAPHAGASAILTGSRSDRPPSLMPASLTTKAALLKQLDVARGFFFKHDLLQKPQQPILSNHGSTSDLRAHHVPIALMGTYTERPTATRLRFADPDVEAMVHGTAFGNPFKRIKSKKAAGLANLDEATSELVSVNEADGTSHSGSKSSSSLRHGASRSKYSAAKRKRKLSLTLSGRRIEDFDHISDDDDVVSIASGSSSHSLSSNSLFSNADSLAVADSIVRRQRAEWLSSVPRIGAKTDVSLLVGTMRLGPIFDIPTSMNLQALEAEGGMSLSDLMQERAEKWLREQKELAQSDIETPSMSLSASDQDSDDSSDDGRKRGYEI